MGESENPENSILVNKILLYGKDILKSLNENINKLLQITFTLED